MNRYTLDHIKSVLSHKGYKFFTGKFNVNIIGVRMLTHTKNTFDDLLYFIYEHSNKKSIIKEYPITTDPGSFWLKKPLNEHGTAIVVPGQYRGVWKIGLHKGEYKALVQQKPIKVYRDNNLDEVLDMDINSIDEGLFGINCHRSNPYSESYFVNKWSAGCQVFKNVSDFRNFIEICDMSAKIYGPSFTYTLLEQLDFEG